ncbi:MAG: hypothetical protein AAF668_02965 [Pseudomonadota bacterium]
MLPFVVGAATEQLRTLARKLPSDGVRTIRITREKSQATLYWQDTENTPDETTT